MFFLSLVILFGLFIFFLFIDFYLISLLISSFFGAPYVPTDNKILNKIFSKIALKKNNVFIELGCGDGRVVRYAVNKYQVKGIGVDINPYLILTLKIINKLKDIDNPQFIYQDIFKTNIKKANYIYLFLMPKMLDKLKKKFKEELNKGTLIISHGFKIPQWENKLIDTLKGDKFNTYYYRI